MRSEVCLQLYCERNALLPRIPRAVGQVIIQDIWAQTWVGWYTSFKILEIQTYIRAEFHLILK